MQDIFIVIISLPVVANWQTEKYKNIIQKSIYYDIQTCRVQTQHFRED